MEPVVTSGTDTEPDQDTEPDTEPDTEKEDEREREAGKEREKEKETAFFRKEGIGGIGCGERRGRLRTGPAADTERLPAAQFTANPQFFAVRVFSSFLFQAARKGKPLPRKATGVKFAFRLDVTFPDHQVVGFKDHLAIGVHVHDGTVPVGVDLAGLLDNDVVQDVVGLTVFIGLLDGGVGQSLVVGQLHALIVKVIAAAHPAAVHTGVVEYFLQIVEDLVGLFLVQVFGGGVGVVEAELDGDAIGLKPLQIGDQILLGIVLVEDAVHPDGDGDAAKRSRRYTRPRT